MNATIKEIQQPCFTLPNKKLFILCWEISEDELFYWLNSGIDFIKCLSGLNSKEVVIFAKIKRTLNVELFETETESDERLEQ